MTGLLPDVTVIYTCICFITWTNRQQNTWQVYKSLHMTPHIIDGYSSLYWFVFASCCCLICFWFNFYYSHHFDCSNDYSLKFQAFFNINETRSMSKERIAAKTMLTNIKFVYVFYWQFATGRVCNGPSHLVTLFYALLFS